MKLVWSVRPWERWTLAAIGVLALVAAIVTAVMWREAHADPVVARYDVVVKGLQAPMTVALLTDTHVNEDALASSVNLARLRTVVARVNALSPDMIVLGGDYVATAHAKGDVPFSVAVSPFSSLRSRYGTYSVIGNHDCQEPQNTTRSMRRALVVAGTMPLVNEYIDIGPLRLVGLDDLWCGESDIGAVHQALDDAGDRPVLVVSHNPDVFPGMPRRVALTLAGHTHAGQIVPPLLGPVVSVSRYGHRYRYGMVVEDGRRMVVSAGLGGLPLRWNARPEIVMVRLRPPGFTEPSGPPRG